MDADKPWTRPSSSAHCTWRILRCAWLNRRTTTSSPRSRDCRLATLRKGTLSSDCRSQTKSIVQQVVSQQPSKTTKNQSLQMNHEQRATTRPGHRNSVTGEQQQLGHGCIVGRTDLIAMPRRWESDKSRLRLTDWRRLPFMDSMRWMSPLDIAAVKKRPFPEHKKSSTNTCLHDTQRKETSQKT